MIENKHTNILGYLKLNLIKSHDEKYSEEILCRLINGEVAYLTSRSGVTVPPHL
jgi:hypothetical protein